MSHAQNPIIRRPKAAISLFSINIFHLRNPLVVAWWSLVYPGFGHLRLISIAKGVFLFAGELLINTQAHINLAILYSFIGNFAMAKQVLNTRLLLLYCGILVYAVWDSYRVSIEINKVSVLADHENDPLMTTVLSGEGLNFFEKRNPWVAVAWSMLVPGAGHLYCLSIIIAMFMIIGGAVIIYLSHLLPAISYTAMGQFAQAKEVLDWQWLLNVPSFYCFGIYDSYVKSVEINKIFDQEQAQFLRNKYQSPQFPMPLKSTFGGNQMYLVASFHYNMHMEIAIAKVEELGIKKEQIFAVPLEKRGETRNIFDTIHHADGVSMFDGGAILGSACMILGVIYGFVLAWGPIIWGLIGLGVGFLVGFLLDISFTRIKHSKERRNDKDGELFLMIHCDEQQIEKVKKALWDHLALGVAVI